MCVYKFGIFVPTVCYKLFTYLVYVYINLVFLYQLCVINCSYILYMGLYKFGIVVPTVCYKLLTHLYMGLYKFGIFVPTVCYKLLIYLVHGFI